MNKEVLDDVFYVVPDFEKKEVSLLSETVKEIGVFSLDEEPIPEVIKIGIICHFIANGGSIISACKNPSNWSMSTTKFFSLTDSNEKYGKMYRIAREVRVNALEEEIVEEQNKKSSDKENQELFKKKLSVLKALKESLKLDEEKSKDDKTVVIVSWANKKFFKKKETDE